MGSHIVGWGPTGAGRVELGAVLTRISLGCFLGIHSWTFLLNVRLFSVFVWADAFSAQDESKASMNFAIIIHDII